MSERPKRQEENGVHFNKECWPTSGTVVPGIPADLNDLWDGKEDQATVFIAEALINDNWPRTHLSFDQDKVSITVWLWECGGDVLTLEKPIEDLITDGASDYDVIRNAAQLEDVESRVVKLRALAKVIDETAGELEAQATAFKAPQS